LPVKLLPENGVTQHQCEGDITIVILTPEEKENILQTCAYRYQAYRGETSKEPKNYKQRSVSYPNI